MPFTSGTWVTEAVKRWGDYWVLLNSHFNELYIAFDKLLLQREHLVRKSLPSIMCQGCISTGKLTLCYVSFKMGTEKQEKHTVYITLLFTCEGHKAIWEPWILFFWTSGFLTRRNTNSHRQGLVWDFCPSSLVPSYKARYRLTQARSHCWLWQLRDRGTHENMVMDWTTSQSEFWVVSEYKYFNHFNMIILQYLSYVREKFP
jgi:hypothetical protein